MTLAKRFWGHAGLATAKYRVMKNFSHPWNAHALLHSAHEFSSWPACSATQNHEIDFRHFAYASGMDKQRENGALLVAACIVAAIRLRGEPIQPSPTRRLG
jgi:hypothetical protein